MTSDLPPMTVTEHKQVRRRSPSKRIAPWVAPAGFGLLVLTILFLMGLVIAATMGYPVPCSGRGLVVFVIALSTGAAAGFLTGSAKAEGKIPFFGGNVMQVAASGAIGAIVVVVFVGFQVFASAAACGSEDPQVTAREKDIAQRVWQSGFASDWKEMYDLFPAVLHQQMTFQDFVKATSHGFSQFAGPPKNRHFERADIISGTLTVSHLAVFDRTSTFREQLAFQRDGSKWVPWSFIVNPVEWPQANSYRFVTGPASAIVGAIASVPPNDRPKAVIDQYAGRYVQPPGWELVVDSVIVKADERTCDVSTKEKQTTAPVTLRRALDGCTLASGAIIQAIGRIESVSGQVTLDAVRFWR